jgi:hypothetical protein
MDMLECTVVSNVSSERRHSYHFFLSSSLKGTRSKFGYELANFLFDWKELKYRKSNL